MVGNELLSSGRAGEGRRCVQDPCPLSGTAPGGESTFFQSCFCTSNCKIDILSVYHYPPSLVALKPLLCEMVWWKRNLHFQPRAILWHRADGTWHCLCPPWARTSSGFVSTTCCLSPISGGVYFFPS